jgi:C4-dicarboxylate-specific signal transduction histidine kinase
MSRNDSDDAAQDAGLEVFGRIAASVSHEFNNVITIIGEVNGLLEDMLLLAERGRAPDMDKLRGQCSRIGKQVRRGRDIIKQLNRFAHRVDSVRTEIDLNEVVENTVALARRAFEMRRIELDFTPAAEPVLLTSSPFRVQELLFHLLDAFLEPEQSGGSVDLAIGQSDSNVRVSVRAEVCRAACSRSLAAAHQLAAALGGHIDADEDDGGPVAIQLVLPRHPGL